MGSVQSIFSLAGGWGFGFIGLVRVLYAPGIPEQQASVSLPFFSKRLLGSKESSQLSWSGWLLQQPLKTRTRACEEATPTKHNLNGRKALRKSGAGSGAKLLCDKRSNQNLQLWRR